VPGLINAYKMATEEAFTHAVIIEKTVNDVYTISFSYLQMNDIMRLVKEADLAILNQQFDNNCSMQVSIRKMQVNMVLDKLHKLTGFNVKYDHSI
jgi:putative IMPACT (imprinted ancient) family translation regulator